MLVSVQGEPLDNYHAVLEAVTSLTYYFKIPYSRITVSTVGVTHAIRKLAAVSPDVQLAISLHAPNDTIREQIVPTARSYSVAKIMEAVGVYLQNCPSKKKRVMIEYICIDGINTSPECAHELGRLVQHTRSIVNLIPYNPTVAGDEHGYQAPTDAALMEFQRILYEDYLDDTGKPVRCTIRWSSRRGQSLDAACGQLVVQQQQRKGTREAATQNNTVHDVEDIGQKKRRQQPRSGPVPQRAATRRREDDATQKEPRTSTTSVASWSILAAGIVTVSTMVAVVLLRGRSKRAG